MVLKLKKLKQLVLDSEYNGALHQHKMIKDDVDL